MAAAYQRLLVAKQAIRDQYEILQLRLASASETEAIQELSPDDNHPADLGSETFARELDIGLCQRLRRRLEDFDRAELKWRQGTYGLCDRCGKPIAAERLEAMPEANYCVPCQDAMTPPYEPPPSETSVVPMPFGVPAPRDAVELDGEDIWQSLADWGTSNSPSDVPPAIDYAETFVDFENPENYVEVVETLVDEQHKAVLDEVRKRPLREARRTEAETDEYEADSLD